MSADTQNIDNNNKSDDRIFDELQKLIESVEAEEQEFKVYLHLYILLNFSYYNLSNFHLKFIYFIIIPN